MWKIGESCNDKYLWLPLRYRMDQFDEFFKLICICTKWELFASQIPDRLKSLRLGLGLSMSSSALRGYFCSIILSVVMKITTKNGKPGLVPPTLNDGHLDRFFFLSAALTALTLGLFTLAAKRFKCITMEKQDYGSQVCNDP